MFKEKSASVGLIIGSILFGLGSIIVAKLPIGAYAIAFWRLAISGLAFLLLVWLLRTTLPKQKATCYYALLSGVFLAFDLALWHESIYAIGPGISTLLNSLQIFWLTLIGLIWFKEKLNLYQIVSLFLAVVGVGLIASPEIAHNQQALWGFVSGLASGFFLALSMVYVKKAQQTEPISIFVLMLLLSIGGMLALILPMYLFDSGKILPTTIHQLGWIIVYGLIMQCIAWGLIAYSIPLLSLSLTGLLLLSEPVAALLIDYFLLAKPINLVQWCGALLTLIAIYLGILQRNK
ncbi:DMT family transporter [Volucribacter amazonae]|uniref:EamA domain-containing protein n=1 Tax=Volucribacter amazonae TaxID=256731 RepID=A0A9X4PJ20_9PAST|nr:DMT family transporter [Volucribacter amazonae]MDG6896290.1 hypothetical protein [Volucribacter amazonae]